MLQFPPFDPEILILQSGQFFRERFPLLPAVGLTLQGTQMRQDLLRERPDLVQIYLGVPEPPLRFRFFKLVFPETEHLLDHFPTPLGRRLDEHIAVALGDDHQSLGAQARLGEKVHNVLETHFGFIQEIFVRTVPAHLPAHGYLFEIHREEIVLVPEMQARLCLAQPRPIGGPGEDEVLGLRAAQVLRLPLAQKPADAIDDVRLAGAVRTHDGGDAARKIKNGLRGEGFEAGKFQLLKKPGHYFIFWSAFLAASSSASCLDAPPPSAASSSPKNTPTRNSRRCAGPLSSRTR